MHRTTTGTAAKLLDIRRALYLEVYLLIPCKPASERIVYSATWQQLCSVKHCYVQGGPKMDLTPLHVALMLSILMCSLVAGLLFGFAVVVMPGIAKLDDKGFLLAFKHMDEIIQNNQPLFILVWAGSIFTVLATLILGTMNLTGTQVYLLLVASAL